MQKEPIPMNDPDPMRGPMQDLLRAAQALLLAGAKSYAQELPKDAHAWATMLAAGRVMSAVRVDMALDGAHVQLGYQEIGGAFHPFFSWPHPGEKPDISKLN